ncbi:MAG: T9SS type A sorting domain-containing protein [Chitinophagales bacterium]|nr:T9SS type A sorting domain-containing protein [Chitinophagales bacterium]
MKNNLCLLLSMLLLNYTSAQFCGSSGNSQCSTSGNLTSPGFSPNSENFAPFVNGQTTTQIIQFKNFNLLYFGGQSVTVQSLRVDSIENLPSGLCWSTNKPNNTFANSEQGCIKITGTACSQPGQYKLRIIITVDIGVPINTDVDALGWKYYIRVKNYGNSDVQVDTNQTAPFLQPVGYSLSAVCNVPCTSGPSVCTPTGGPTGGGFENSSNIPCITQNTSYSHPVQYKNYSTFNFQGQQSVDSIEFLNIENLPCGLCWAFNKSTKRYNANEDGCLSISGTTTDAIGQYKLALTLKVWLNGTPVGVTVPPTLVDQLGIKLFVRVKANSGSCASLDTTINASNLIPCGQNLSIAIGGNQTVCSGTSISLTPTVLNGSPPYNFFWSSTGNSLSCTNCENPTSIITQNTLFSVTVTDQNGSTASSTVSYVVSGTNYNIIPLSSTTFCFGDNVTLDAGANFISYNWSNGSQSRYISVSQTGSYQVTVTNSIGCSFTDNVSVTSNAPVLSNYEIKLVPGYLNTGCEGATVLLDAGTGFTNYQWSWGGGTTQVLGVFLDAGSQVIQVQAVYLADGCTYSDTIELYGIPIVQPQIYISGDSLIADVGGASGTFQWYFDGNIVIGHKSNFIVPHATGTYSVSFTDTTTGYNCTQYADITVVVQGIHQPLINHNIILSPNPSNGSFTVSLETEKAETIQLKVFDLLGQLVKQENPVTISGNYTKQLNITQLPKGIYLLQVIADGQTISKRIEIQ